MLTVKCRGSFWNNVLTINCVFFRMPRPEKGSLLQ